MGDNLEIRNATKYYKKFKAVDDVSLFVSKGEFVTILGPSGSGKTSLLKLIAGFEELSSGSIMLNDQDITSKKPYERNIGMLFQNYALFPHMTVAENIAYPLRLRKLSKEEVNEKVRDILKIVHLESYGMHYPKQLSGGQQQRVALARAIVFNPPLLLLDEPLGALDKNLRQQMQLEIKHIQVHFGITTISVTHDQEEALTMSDRICVMNHGRVEQIDTPENVYKYPRNRFVAEFIGEINLLSGVYVGTEKGSAIFKLRNDQTVQVSAEHAQQAGSRTSMLLAIRPELIRLSTAGHDFPNNIRAKVVELIYLGEAVKAKLLADTGEPLTVKIPSYQARELFIGKEILLGWNPSDATVIQEETSEPTAAPAETLV